MNPRTDAGFLSIFSGKAKTQRINVRTISNKRPVGQNLILCAAAFSAPGLRGNLRPLFRGKTAAKTGRDPQREQCRFDQDRAGAAERIVKRAVPADMKNAKVKTAARKK